MIDKLLKQVNVVYSGPKEEKNPYCRNCNRLKLRHNSDQTENCIRAIYLKA